MTEGAPRPIRLTHRRAQALLEMVSIGLDESERRLRQDLRATPDDALEMREIKERDAWLLSAKDAAQIIRERYAGGKETPAPDNHLF